MTRWRRIDEMSKEGDVAGNWKGRRGEGSGEVSIHGGRKEETRG